MDLRIAHPHAATFQNDMAERERLTVFIRGQLAQRLDPLGVDLLTATGSGGLTEG